MRPRSTDAYSDAVRRGTPEVAHALTSTAWAKSVRSSGHGHSRSLRGKQPGRIDGGPRVLGGTAIPVDGGLAEPSRFAVRPDFPTGCLHRQLSHERQERLKTRQAPRRVTDDSCIRKRPQQSHVVGAASFLRLQPSCGGYHHLEEAEDTRPHALSRSRGLPSASSGRSTTRHQTQPGDTTWSSSAGSGRISGMRSRNSSTNRCQRSASYASSRKLSRSSYTDTGSPFPRHIPVRASRPTFGGRSRPTAGRPARRHPLPRRRLP